MMEESPGKVLNRKYRLLGALGHGAMGVVYRAEQLDPEGTPQRQVALKTMRPEFSADPDFARRFLREVRVAMQLHSSHAVTVHDSGRDEDGQLYYAMELVRGPTLKAVLQQQGPLPVARVVSIVGQLCEALAEAHRLPVVHRDLKPANIFLEERQGQDWVKIGDFGIAKVLGEHGSTLTRDGLSPGTPLYMAPEQWTGQAVDGRTDLYALGIVLYELLTGRPPFTARGHEALLYQHLQQAPPPLPAAIPAGLRQQIERLLAKAPHERPPDALSVRRALEAVGAEEAERSTVIVEPEQQPLPVVVPTSPDSVAKPKRQGDQRGRQRSIGKRAVVVAIGLVLLGVAGVALRGRFIDPALEPPPAVAPAPSQTGEPSEPPPALPLPDKPSIVVLPFVNMSADPEQEYFSDGITEDLTSDLSRISSLFVIARNSAFTYKGKPVKVQEVGSELGVQYVLEGSVRKADDRVRITAQLVDAATGYHLWAERYDRPLTDIFVVQDELTRRIVGTLQGQLALWEQGIPLRRRTDSLDAYDAFLRGAEYSQRLTRDANAQARQHFERAIALDPQYGEAYAWLGWTYWIDWTWQWNQDSETQDRALALAQRAIALDDALSQAHLLLGSVYLRQKRYDQAMAKVQRAIALDPNDPEGYSTLADILNWVGRPEEAIALMEKAMHLNPQYPVWYIFQLGWAYRLTGRLDEAIAMQKQALSRSPDYLFPYTELAFSYFLQWRFQFSADPTILDQAEEMAQRAIALSPSMSWAHIVLSYIYLAKTEYERALAEAEQAVALAPTEAGSYVGLATVLNAVGRAQEALSAAEQAQRLYPQDPYGSSFLQVGAAYVSLGRYAEALAPLQHFTRRNPNFLGAHGLLAIAYSELGQQAEAQAEVAEVLRLNPNYSLEGVRQRMPFKEPALTERAVAALRKAGLK
jgi:TolB-like protein/Flp pilus assembly protein TadD